MQFWPYKGRILSPDKNPKSGLMSDLFRTKFLEFGTDRNPQNRGFWDPTFGLKVGGPTIHGGKKKERMWYEGQLISETRNENGVRESWWYKDKQRLKKKEWHITQIQGVFDDEADETDEG